MLRGPQLLPAPWLAGVPEGTGGAPGLKRHVEAVSPNPVRVQRQKQRTCWTPSHGPSSAVPSPRTWKMRAPTGSAPGPLIFVDAHQPAGPNLHQQACAVTPSREVFLRVEPLVGEQAQVDWAHVGQVKVPGGQRALWLFVMVLCWSRGMWGEFVFDTGAHSLARSLVRAAQYFGGTSRQWLFDNPKAVVLERHGEAVRFHPVLLEVAGHYRVQPRVCQVRKANQKGKVERAIRYLRERFLAGRTVHSVEGGNRELWAFLEEVAHARPHPTQPGRNVAECLAEEKQRLLPLPATPAATDRVQPAHVDSTAFVRFDTNSYSVPAHHAGTTLTLVADDSTVRLLEGAQQVARHARCWGRHQVVELHEHRQALLALKRRARETKGQDRLRTAIPNVDALFSRWVEAGRNVGSLTARTLRLLDAYGDTLLAEAVAEVLTRGTHDPGALAAFCEQRRRALRQPLPLEVSLGSHVPDRDVTPHPLERYDLTTRRRD